MTAESIQRQTAKEILKPLRARALGNGSATDGAVTCRRVDLKRRMGEFTSGMRFDYFINGNRVSVIDVARFMDPEFDAAPAALAA